MNQESSQQLKTIMKIFKNNFKNNSKTIALSQKRGDIGNIKYLPSFSKEWKNILYCYNKNNLKNIPVNNININKIIKSYFNLYFQNPKFAGSNQFILPKRRRNFVRRIYVSNAEIKHTNNRAKILLYTVNRESLILKKKYLKINKKVSENLIKRFLLLYNVSEACVSYKNKYLYECTFSVDRQTPTKIFVNYKLKYLNKFLKFHTIYLKKIWSLIINKYWNRYLKFLRKYDLMYSLNKYKFNRQIFLPFLSKILNKIIRKKIEYNIINLKSITYNTDLFTNALALKLKSKKHSGVKNMFSILNRVPIIDPKDRSRLERPKSNLILPHKHKDLKLISILKNTGGNLDKILGNNAQKVHNTIYNSISYKNMRGIRLEIKGRLTKRYRADRSVYSLKWKGGLKNIDSSLKGLSSVLFRGNSNSNISYSVHNSKRRIGAFAVKGWISGA